MTRIRIVDIAREAKVSPAAVSLVLNGKAGSHVSAPEREKVLALARKYNYRPNLSASNLRKKEQKTIGICMPASSDDANTIMLLEQQRYLQAHHYQSLFSFWQVPPASHEVLVQEIKNAFEVSFSHNVNGIIAWHYYDLLKRENIPTVIFGSMHPDFDCVSPDYAGQGVMAIELLTELGHRNLAYFGHPGLQSKLFCEVLQERGLPFREEWNCTIPRGDKRSPSIFTVMEMSRLLRQDERPTGIICHNERFADAMQTAVSAFGLRIPDDISIISMEMECRTLRDQLFDTVSTDIRTNIHTTVDCLLARMEYPDRPLQSIYIRPEYTARGSCAAAPLKLEKKVVSI